MKVILRAEAVEDLQHARTYYRQGGSSSEERFLSQVERKLGQLAIHPESGPVATGAIRRLLIPRTSFAVYYRVIKEVIVVIAVLDLRSRPERIQSRIDQDRP